MEHGGEPDLDAVNGGQQIASTAALVLRYVGRIGGEASVRRLLELSGHAAGGADERARLENAAAWCTYSEIVRLFDAAVEVSGDPEIARKIGEELLRQYAASEVATLLRSLGSPSAVLENISATASKFSTVSSLTAAELTDDHAVIEAKTLPPLVRSHHFCLYMTGLLSQPTALFGLDASEVEELECQTRGDAACVYRVTYPAAAGDGDVNARVAVLEVELAAMTVRFEALQATATELVSAASVEEVLAAVTSRAGLAVRAPQFLLAVRLDADDELRAHHAGFTSDEAARELADALLSGDEQSEGSLLVVDVATTRRHFGVLAAGFPGVGGFLPQERLLLAAYAGHAAAVLEAAAALEEAKRRNDTARALLALGRSLAHVQSEQEVADRLAEVMPHVVASKVAVVLLREPGEDVLRVTAASGPARVLDTLLGMTVDPDDTPILLEILAERRPLLLERSSSDPFVTGFFDLCGTSSAAVVPIVVEGEVAGVVACDFTMDQPMLDVVERLEGLADQAGMAMLNARLLAAVQAQALHDSLTGLPNARYIAQRTAAVVDGAEPGETRMALLFIDLDHFKPINDQYGHAAGDEVLRVCAQRLRAQLRADDVVARLGGDEFVVLVTNLERPEHAMRTAERLCRSLDEPFTIDGNVVGISSSIGIALFPDHGEDFDALLKQADAAMYMAKSRRRGTFELSPT